MQAARSRARASCNRSPTGRTGARGPPCPGLGIATAVTTGSPRDHVVRAEVNFPRDILAEYVVVGHLVINDMHVIRSVSDPLQDELADRIAISLAHHER